MKGGVIDEGLRGSTALLLLYLQKINLLVQMVPTGMFRVMLLVQMVPTGHVQMSKCKHGTTVGCIIRSTAGVVTGTTAVQQE